MVLTDLFKNPNVEGINSVKEYLSNLSGGFGNWLSAIENYPVPDEVKGYVRHKDKDTLIKEILNLPEFEEYAQKAYNSAGYENPSLKQLERLAKALIRFLQNN